jgi:hypothetical protein
LQEIHRVLTKGLLRKKEQGEFRNIPVSITATDYTPPAFGKEFIIREVEYILKNANEIENPIKNSDLSS